MNINTANCTEQQLSTNPSTPTKPTNTIQKHPPRP